MYYVYALHLEGELPFYIGKGHGSRAYDHLSGQEGNNRHKNNKIKKAIREGREIIVTFLHEGCSEQESLTLEMLEITKYGRVDLGTGCLTNLTNGGEGVSGYKPSPEQNRLNSKRLTGKKASEETKAKMSDSAKKPKSMGHAAKIKAAKIKSYEDESYRVRQRESIRAACSNDAFRAKMSEVKLNVSHEQSAAISAKLAISKLGELNPMFGKPAWLHPNVIKKPKILKLWSLAGLLYLKFSETNTSKGFMTILRENGIPEVSDQNIINKFKNGWNPFEDKLWVEWSAQYLNG